MENSGEFSDFDWFLHNIDDLYAPSGSAIASLTTDSAVPDWIDFDSFVQNPTGTDDDPFNFSFPSQSCASYLGDPSNAAFDNIETQSGKITEYPEQLPEPADNAVARATAKSKKNDSPLDLPGCSSFSIARSDSTKPKRAKFPQQRRKEVAEVRGLGACLRCRYLKVSVSDSVYLSHRPHCRRLTCKCSNARPCRSCMQVQTSCSQREPRYKWMRCLPFSLKDVDLYSMCESIPMTINKQC